jgi:hypothetical protein
MWVLKKLPFTPAIALPAFPNSLTGSNKESLYAMDIFKVVSRRSTLIMFMFSGAWNKEGKYLLDNCTPGLISLVLHPDLICF